MTDRATILHSRAMKFTVRERIFYQSWLIIWGFYALDRCLFLVWNRDHLWQLPLPELAQAFLLGLRFDFVALSLLSFLPFLFFLVLSGIRSDKVYRNTMLLIVWIIQFPFLVFNLIDNEYIRFSGRRLTSQSFFILGELSGKAQGFLETQGLVIALSGSILILFSFALFKNYQTASLVAKRSWPWWLRQTLVLVFLLIASRGGLQKKPINLAEAKVFPNSWLNHLALNSTFTILKTFKENKPPRYVYFQDRQELEKNLSENFPGVSLLPKLIQKPNVVIIVMESFARNYMGEINGVKGFTPFLDQLTKKSLFFPNAFANSRRSIEGIAAVFAGVPALMEQPFITSSYDSEKVASVGAAFAKKNYDTSFFHGGNNGTMHFDSFMNSIGIKKYFGVNEFPDKKANDGIWGIYDQPMFQFFAEKLSEFPKPFFAGFFSISSHEPYLIPKEVRANFPDGPLPILKAIAYADDSLKKFFETAQNQSWYENTIFIITADHSFESYLPNSNELDLFRIPLLIYAPGWKTYPKVDILQPVQQIDILPTVLEILEEKNPFPLSRSLFRKGERTAIFWDDGNYYFVSKGKGLFWDRKNEIQEFEMNSPAIKSKNQNKFKADQFKAHLQRFSETFWDQKIYYQK